MISNQTVLFSFKRTKLMLWGDRLAYPIPASLISVGCVISAFYGIKTASFPPAAIALLFITGLLLLSFAIWVFIRVRVPSAINIYPSMVEVEYLGGETIGIKKNNIRAIVRGAAGSRVARQNLIEVQDGTKTEYIPIHSGYVDEQGKFYNGKAIIQVLRRSIQ